MKKYIVRSLKYFFALCVLCIALMGLMLMTGTSALSLDDTLYVMLHTDRYLMLFAAIVALAAVYPRFGFVVRRVEGDIEENREQILNAFRSAGFSLRSDEDGVMTFRADNFGQKLMLLGEDEIAQGKCSVKDMRSGEQITVTPEEAVAHIQAGLAAGNGPIILEK